MFTMTVVGADTFTVGKECIEFAEFITDIPKDSDARTADVGTTLVVRGKILAGSDGATQDNTRNMALWSAVPAKKADSYRAVTLKNVRGNVVVREYMLPNAFVVDYEENYDDKEGVGTFELKMKQKKDRIEYITVHGGFAG